MWCYCYEFAKLCPAREIRVDPPRPFAHTKREAK
jgi:hypothetical protein